MDKRIIGGQLVMLLALLPCVFGADSDMINRCLAGIAAIKSYDVTFHLDILQYLDCNDTNKPENVPVVAWTQTNRDVFAIGLGRRLETAVGNKDAFDIGVIDWKAVKANGWPRSQAILNSLPGRFFEDHSG